MRISINGSGLLANPDLGVLIRHIEDAEQQGFHRYWTAQSGLVDTLTMFVAAAPSTQSIRLGTAVVPTFSRHPSTLAGQALTAASVLCDRLDLGIGMSHQPHVEQRYGMEFDRPIKHLCEYLDALLPLMETGTADSSGEIHTSRMEAGLITEHAPPVYIAALGPQALRIAGRRSLGTLLWMVGPATVENHIVPTISEAAAGADRPDPEVICSLPVCVTDDESSTRSRASTIFQAYNSLPSYRAMLDREGVEGPGDVAVVGSARQVTEALDGIAAAGATEFSALEFGASPKETEATRDVLQSYNG